MTDDLEGPGVGHNSGDSQRIAAAELRSYLERVERLNEEKAAISQDIREVFKEAKGRGYDVKSMREVLKARKQDAGERAEQQAITAAYLDALGML